MEIRNGKIISLYCGQLEIVKNKKTKFQDVIEQTGIGCFENEKEFYEGNFHKGKYHGGGHRYDKESKQSIYAVFKGGKVERE